MSARHSALLAVAALTAAGCGTGARDAVKAKVQQFAEATRKHDYHAICTQVLAPALVDRLKATGVSCEQGLQIALGDVHDPSVGIGKIIVSGRNASVNVLSLAAGQPASLDTIVLTDTSGGWRISALRSTVGG